MHVRSHQLCALLCGLLGLGACGGESSPVVTTPTIDPGTAEVAGKPYNEAVCVTARLPDLSYAGEGLPHLRQVARTVVAARYPIGLAFIDVQADDELVRWFSSARDLSSLLYAMPTAVHEGSHIWGFRQPSASGGHRYRISDDLQVTTRQLKNFELATLSKYHVNPGADRYHDVYIDGPVGRGQGFNILLDEFNAYVHSLASSYCLRDTLPKLLSTSAKDGALAMMYYVGLYLRVARTEYPQQYAAIVADGEHRRLISLLWRRAEFWLRLAQDVRQLGIEDEQYRRWAYEPQLVDEVKRVVERVLDGDDPLAH